ncbi:MAG: tRNA lysidine(34) synthetase TilS, partial [Burkholderiaceae bacterium]
MVALDRVVEAATASVLGHAFDTLSASPTRVAIAYSGGADSTALLYAASLLRQRGVIDVVALHIHHGLMGAADAWLAHCRGQAVAWGLTFDSERVAVNPRGGSIESEARRLRYAALARLCWKHRCTILMTAHHADDQAETVLVNLARGAGIGGLAATARSRKLDEVLLLRPLLDVAAATIRSYVDAHDLSHIEDPSNHDRRYTRNAIRHEVMPALRRIAPTIATRLAQTAAHASTMQSLLDEIGIEDLQRSADGDDGRADAALDAATGESGLDVDRLRALSDARAANALRIWLARRGMRAPTAAALKQMLDQLRHAAPDAQIALIHERQTLRLYQGRVSVDPGGTPRAGFASLVWHGEPFIDVPSWQGRLQFIVDAEHGFDAMALREGPLALRERRGGERMRVRVDGPSRTLKNL